MMDNALTSTQGTYNGILEYILSIFNYIFYRCDQITNCRDDSDEQNCNLLYLKNGYNFEVPPFSIVCIFSI